MSGANACCAWAAGCPQCLPMHAGSHRRHRGPDGARNGRRPGLRAEHQAAELTAKMVSRHRICCTQSASNGLSRAPSPVSSRRWRFQLGVSYNTLACASHPNRDDQLMQRDEGTGRQSCAGWEHIDDQRRYQDEGPGWRVQECRRQVRQTRTRTGAGSRLSLRCRGPRRALRDLRSEGQGRHGGVRRRELRETPAFAVNCIEKWWRTEGRKRLSAGGRRSRSSPTADGSNGLLPGRVEEFQVVSTASAGNRHRLRVTVAQLPQASGPGGIPSNTGCFVQSVKNWAGRPLDSYATVLKYLRTTRTAVRNMRVRAHLVPKIS